ncbi:MAG: hypothetical protein GY820_28785, partial [Gammaproteobacteria bacterium]|nr:hypothetical protein [Gammaproteobacteria bacterium]
GVEVQDEEVVCSLKPLNKETGIRPCRLVAVGRREGGSEEYLLGEVIDEDHELQPLDRDEIANLQK